MKCILKAKEGYGAKIFYYKENESGDKEVYKDIQYEKRISNYDKESIIPIDENAELISVGNELFFTLEEFEKVKEKFFS